MGLFKTEGPRMAEDRRGTRAAEPPTSTMPLDVDVLDDARSPRPSWRGRMLTPSTTCRLV